MSIDYKTGPKITPYYNNNLSWHNIGFKEYHKMNNTEERAAEYIREDARELKQTVLKDLDNMIDGLPSAEALKESGVKRMDLGEVFERVIKKSKEKVLFYMRLIASVEKLDTIDSLKSEYLEDLRTKLAKQEDVFLSNIRLYDYWKSLNDKK